MLWNHVVPFFCTLLYGVTSYRYDHCQNYKAQTGVDLEEMMGLWYGIEVFYHRERSHSLETRYEDATCPVINLSKESHEISLIWQEPSRYLEYHLRLVKPGVWVSQPKGHPPFEGFVRVLKAVSTHMVLTFCSHTIHYSVLMARDKYLHYSDIEGVESMIERFNLTIYDKSRQCRSSAAVYSSSFYAVFVLALVCLYRS